MKNLTFIASLVFLVIGFLTGCSEEGEEIPVTSFYCTVDYVEFTSVTSAIIKFETEFNGVKQPYFLPREYKTDSNNFFVGNELVSILNFRQNGNKASFVFEYGNALDFFCANLFDYLPKHSHDDFSATAEKSFDDKNVGRWKIRKKQAIEVN